MCVPVLVIVCMGDGDGGELTKQDIAMFCCFSFNFTQGTCQLQALAIPVSGISQGTWQRMFVSLRQWGDF